MMKTLNSDAILRRIAKVVRIRRGELTLREAANQSGVSAATILRVEQGLMPDVITLMRLAEWCGVSTDQLLGVQKLHPARATMLANVRADLERIVDDIKTMES